MSELTLIVRKSAALHGEVSLPGDKSISHRAALLAALADGESRMDHFLTAGVTTVMLNCLTALGVSWTLEEGHLVIQGSGLAGLTTPKVPLDCGNSATTLRLMAGLLSMSGLPAVLDGSESLRRRPMGRIVTPLQLMGVPIISQNGRAPLQLESRSHPLRGIQTDLPVASAQVKSCLILASLAANEKSIIREPGPSRDHTERMLRSQNIIIQNTIEETSAGNVWITEVFPPSSLAISPLEMTIPGDFSAAAFILTAAAITPESEVTLREVGLNPTRTGLLDAILQMGGDVQVHSIRERYGEPVGDISIRSAPLHGIEISGPLVVRMIDEFPAFAVLAAFARGKTIVRDAQELREKESDRIAAICIECKKLGVDIQETPDGFILDGVSELDGGTVDPHNDHRLAMALALMGLRSSKPVQVHRAGIIDESYPDFVQTLQSLGGNLEAV